MNHADLAKKIVISLAMFAISGLWLGAQTPVSLDQILKEIATYDGGIDSAPFWKLRDYVYARKDSAETRAECEAKLLEFLATPATPVAKMAVCRQLRIIGGDRSVAVLQPMLLIPNTADMALYAIQKIPGAAADKALLQTLSKAEGATKTAVIAALGDRKCAEAVQVLTPIVDSQGEFAVAAALALGEIGGSTAGNALKAALAAADSSLKPVAASSLLKIAEGYLASKNGRDALSVYEALSADSKLPLPIRKAAALGKISLSGDRAPSQVVDLLKGADPEMQEVAIQKIKEVIKPEGIGPICDLLPKLPESTQVKALAVLSAYPKEHVLPAVLQAAKSGSESTRIAAYQALEPLGDSSTLQMLVEVATKTRGAEQSAARNTIALLKGRPVDEAVLSWLAKNPAEDVQAELLQAIAERRIFAGKSAVVGCLSSSAPRVRAQALRTLRNIGTPSDVPTMLTFLLQSEEDAEQIEATNTIAALAQKIANQDGRANMVKDRLGREKDPMARIRLFRVLGRIGDDSALPALRVELSGTNAEVVDAAARAIMSWPTPAVRDDVLQLAQKSTNETHRLLALQALLRIIRTDRYRKPEAAVADLRQAYVLASRTEEKRLILGALPNFACAEALDLAGVLLGDPSVKAEAQAAIDRIKPRIVK
jgi:HEAT repeat protein